MVSARAKIWIFSGLQFGEVLHEGSVMLEHTKGDADDLVHDGSKK